MWLEPSIQKQVYLQKNTDLFYLISELALCPTWNYEVINFLSEVVREVLLRKVQQDETTFFCFFACEVHLKIVEKVRVLFSSCF